MMGSKQRHFAPLLHVSLEELVPADHFYRQRFRWKLWPRQITGDSRYGTADNIKAIEQQGIRAYVPLPDFEHRSPYFSQRDFRYDAEQDVYICPNNAILHLHSSSPAEHAKRYQAEAATCNACPLQAKCTPGTSGRYVSRNFAGEYFERVRSYQSTEAYKKALRKRSVWVEPLFARSAKTGTACDAFAYANCGGSTARA